MNAESPMHLWVEPNGDLTACGIRWWNGTRGEEPITCAACSEVRSTLPSVGDVWEWEPLKPARETVTVTEVKWNGFEWWIESDGPRGRHWNSASRWVEATVLATPAEERVAGK